jgi:negative regulator of flagellin synthesis FlgM
MQVNGLSHLHSAQSISGPHRTHAAEATSRADSWLGVDQLDISPEADLVSRVRDLPDTRADRVSELRAQIASGTYEAEAKLDVALGRLLDEMAG